MDRISLNDALVTLPWMFVWAAEPNRPISVEMTYDDLRTIVKFYDEAFERAEQEQDDATN
jgi:predicted enzyme related to lactoylglutathione lyase